MVLLPSTVGVAKDGVDGSDVIFCQRKTAVVDFAHEDEHVSVGECDFL